MSDQLLRLVACMNGHFACDDQSPADRETWLQLRRHIVRMRDALSLMYITLREERECSIPLMAEKACQLEGWARWGSGLTAVPKPTWAQKLLSQTLRRALAKTWGVRQLSEELLPCRQGRRHASS
jgi:hypothetical protein